MAAVLTLSAAVAYLTPLQVAYSTPLQPDRGRSASVATAHGQPGAAAVLGYWTPARMRATPPIELSLRGEPDPRPAAGRRGAPTFVPATGPGGSSAAPLRRGVIGETAGISANAVGNEAGFPNRLHGKVFFTLGGSDFSCSGTSINSPGRSLVLSAGHCVFGEGEWATNWMFVPGFRDGKAPYGRWTATKLRSTPRWVSSENISYDIGTAVMARNGDGRGLQDVIGARGIGFNQSRNQTYTSYGYPAEPPFDGESLQSCTSPNAGNDADTDAPQTMSIECDMNGGSSGGGWVVGGTVLSLNSYCNGLVLVCAELPPKLHGPYFSDAAQALYVDSRGRATRCSGRQVTQLGARGSQRFKGGPRRDVIILGAGRDTGIGAKGRDVLCGNRGPDMLRGGAGRDVLRGGPGVDVLRGGPGRDTCVGGSGRDVARSCEVRLLIP